MRKTAVIVSICLLFVTKAFSQSYIPFVQEGKMWTELTFNSINYNDRHVFTFTMAEDTFFNGKTYKIVNDPYNSFYIYDDTVNEKVYLYDTFFLKDSLWYDFSLQIGDSIDLECSYLILINKEVEYFAGKNRLKFDFSWDFGNPSVLTWYEGIGSINGVFYPYCMTGSIDTLLCYFENYSLLYHNTTLNDDCFLITETQDLQLDNTFYTYFSENILYVKLSKNIPYTLFVYDLFGRKLCQISASGNMEKDFSNLPAGMYLWRVESKGESGVFSGKFLKD